MIEKVAMLEFDKEIPMKIAKAIKKCSNVKSRLALDIFAGAKFLQAPRYFVCAQRLAAGTGDLPSVNRGNRESVQCLNLIGKSL